MYNWTFIGAMSYLILFQASTWFTELITASKYPEYKEYQSRVSKFLPSLYTDLPGDFSDQRAVKMVQERIEEKKERAVEKKAEKKGGKKNGTAKK